MRRIALAVAAATVLALAPAAGASSVVQTLAPTLQRAHELLGPAPASDRAVALVSLRLRDEAGLKALIERVTDPTDPQYGRYLTPDQFHARFSPTADQVAAVASWLRASGLQVLDVPANRLYVLAAGTAAQAQSAFGVAMDRVRANGQTFDVPRGAARVPASLAGVVAGVRGLDSGDQAHVDSILPPPAFVNAPPCSAYYGEKVATGLPAALGQTSFPWAPCGYTPQQLHSAYGLNPVYGAGVDGRGVTVAIIDPFDSPRQEQDTNTYSARHGLPPAQLVRVTDPVATLIPTLPGGLIDPDNATQEETLDVEAVHTMAPGATIVYEASDSLLNISLQVAQNDVVDNHRAQIVSNSYGGRADGADPNEDAIFMQAAAEGIGFCFSSGDAGDETLDPNGPGDRETDALANNPWVTTVGGTSMAIDAGGGVDWQTYWGSYTSTLSAGAWTPSTFYAGGGGGTSQAYGEPDYQKGVVPSDLASFWQGKPGEAGLSGGVLGTSTPPPQVPGRVEPDISMLGDPNTGMLVGDTQDFTVFKNPLGLQLPTDDVHYGEFRIGGTSLSAPLFAGMVALADQAAGRAHGFLNPALYAAYKADPAIAQDISASSVKRAVVRNNYVNNTDGSGGTQTVLRDFDDPVTLHDRPGFDDATGMGTPNGLRFLRALAPGSTLLPAESAAAPWTEARARIRGPRRATCARGGKLTFRLRAAAGHRIVKAVAYVNGRRRLTRTGYSLKTIVVRRPSRARVRVRIVVTSDSGKRTTFRKTYRACARRRA